MTPLPILLYHAVDDDPPAWIAPFAVSRRAFAEQLDSVVASGRVPVTADSVVAALLGGPPLPDRAVAVTFDDGFLDFESNAVPELMARALPVTLFVTTGALAPLNRSVLPPAAMLSLDRVGCLAREAGIGIGAHSHLHEQLDTLEPAAVLRELLRPKQILEAELGRDVALFAYPHGHNDVRVRKLAQRVGYHGAFAVRDAFSPRRDDPFRIARLTVRADTRREQFEAWLRGTGAPTAGPREAARTVLWRHWRRRQAGLRQVFGG